MDLLDVASRLLGSRAGGPLLTLGNRLLFIDSVRRLLVQWADRWLQLPLAQRAIQPAHGLRIARERRLLALAILHTVDRLVTRRALSAQVTRVALELWAREALMPAGKQAAGQLFEAKHGCGPPWFLVISPGHACNLHCPGCYANSGSEAKLPWETLDRIITNARELWSIPLVVFSGGEPLAYQSQGLGILDAAEKHPECMYLVFTNGTLIDQATASHMARLGGMTPAVSVEGMCECTDQRRGDGIFDRVLGAMANLRQAGVPFGISVTVTRSNCEEVLSDEFLDFFFKEQGAFYGFFFQYMPIGRRSTLDRMPTPAQRVELWRRSWEVIKKKHIFLFDFWNSGPLVQGCVSAGREGGYVHIDWNGNVMPCVFAPYSVANIHKVFAQGKSLNDVWQAPFFQAIREWQRGYGYGQGEPTSQGNWLRPCPIRDHHRLFREWVDQCQPEPEDEAARRALSDEAYYKGLVAYGIEVGEYSQEIWENQYVSAGGA